MSEKWKLLECWILACGQVIPQFGPCGADELKARMMKAVASLGPVDLRQILQDQGTVAVSSVMSEPVLKVHTQMLVSRSFDLSTCTGTKLKWNEGYSHKLVAAWMRICQNRVFKLLTEMQQKLKMQILYKWFWHEIVGRLVYIYLSIPTVGSWWSW
jgi:hypothetical protein